MDTINCLVRYCSTDKNAENVCQIYKYLSCVAVFVEVGRNVERGRCKWIHASPGTSGPTAAFYSLRSCTDSAENWM